MTKNEKIDQILEVAKNMILAGVLLKNVKRHFTNLGVSEELAEKICKVAAFDANEFQVYKAI